MLAVSAASAATLGCVAVLRRGSTFEHRAAQGSARRFEPVQVTGLLIMSWVIMGATRWLAVLLDCDGIERAPAVPQAKAKPRAPGAVQQTRLCPVGGG